jgi:hypothetical protein
LDVDKALKARGQYFKIGVVKGRRNVHAFFLGHFILLLASFDCSKLSWHLHGNFFAFLKRFLDHENTKS